MPPCRVPIGLWRRSSAAISKTARPGSTAFSTKPSNRPTGGGGASPRSILPASSRIVGMCGSSQGLLALVEGGRVLLFRLDLRGRLDSPEHPADHPPEDCCVPRPGQQASCQGGERVFPAGDDRGFA